MRFSVIIPVYNAKSYLSECIDSLLSQKDGPDFELIFVDDGSTDGSDAILDRFQSECSEKIRVFHTSNRGTILARKTGIDHATGEYLLFCDADDRMALDAMDTIDKRLRETEADILIYNHYEFSSDLELKPFEPMFEDGALFVSEPDAFSSRYAECFPGRPVYSKEILYRMMISGWTLNNLWIKAIRTDYMQEDPTDWSFFADNPMSDDLLASLWPMTKAGRISYCSRQLYEYRRTAGGLTQSFNKTRYQRLIDGRVLSELRKYMDIWQLNGDNELLLFERRRLLQRIDTAMAFFRHAEERCDRKMVLEQNWFIGLENGKVKRKEVLKTLDPKRFVQYCLILGKHDRLLSMCLGRGNK